ncbi:MFS transporter [Lysinibacillus alkalisoli]|uniref:MFS transporter n=1 Tax=Lysinibacillus alkalisoli TaxID=1911548 RepID=A0A917LFC8_9BACI|nr:YbfB/YjiJ family MFS transporter [Lysinibacillus alkalisoli]GGG17812.1 MFS transporter [Lysinibacillus alkalisoli]
MKKDHVGIIFGGVLLLVVAMGISRFAFTPILPFMRHDVGFSVEVASYLASSNYIGYFVGALWAGFIIQKRKGWLLIAAFINVGSVVWMGITDSYSLWLILRFVAGVTGGLVFVLTSSIVMDYLARHALSSWSGYLFSGIGLGIAISGLLVPYLEAAYTWKGTWLGLGALSLFFILVTGFLWRKLHVTDLTKSPKKQDAHTPKLTKGFMPWFIAAYGLEGLGYIITGTFLVDIIHNIPALQAYSSLSWVIAGIAAVPSAPIWSMLITKYSPIKVLSIAYILQVFGILLPVFSQSIGSVLLSAFLFGMTFVGIVTMSTAYARQLFPTRSGPVVSILTTFYAFGQIIGPLGASKFASHYNSYNAALWFAGIMVFVGVCIMWIGALVNRPSRKTQTIV